MRVSKRVGCLWVARIRPLTELARIIFVRGPPRSLRRGAAAACQSACIPRVARSGLSLPQRSVRLLGLSQASLHHHNVSLTPSLPRHRSCRVSTEHRSQILLTYPSCSEGRGHRQRPQLLVLHRSRLLLSTPPSSTPRRRSYLIISPFIHGQLTHSGMTCKARRRLVTLLALLPLPLLVAPPWTSAQRANPPVSPSSRTSAQALCGILAT